MDFHKQDHTTTTPTSNTRARFMNMMVRSPAKSPVVIPKYEEHQDHSGNSDDTHINNNMVPPPFVEQDHNEEADNISVEEKKQKTKRVNSTGNSGGGGGTSCQADKCTADLTEAKRYHRRHKVCEFHAKAASVLVSGLRQRFCQQCSRFHELAEFDETKRSCGRRLAGHNERRRKSSSEAQGEGGPTPSRQKGDGGPQCRPTDIERGSSRVQMPYPAGNSATTYKHLRSDKFGVVSD